MKAVLPANNLNLKGGSPKNRPFLQGCPVWCVSGQILWAGLRMKSWVSLIISPTVIHFIAPEFCTENPTFWSAQPNPRFFQNEVTPLETGGFLSFGRTILSYRGIMIHVVPSFPPKPHRVPFDPPQRPSFVEFFQFFPSLRIHGIRLLLKPVFINTGHVDVF